MIYGSDAAPGPELSLEWHQEIRRRCREVDDGLVELRDAAEVFQQAQGAWE